MIVSIHSKLCVSSIILADVHDSKQVGVGNREDGIVRKKAKQEHGVLHLMA